MIVMEDSILELYSPIQVDIIDRDASGCLIPLQAAGPEHRQEYLSRVMWAFFELHAQEEARSAFTAHNQDWPEMCEKIISVTRTVRLVNDRPYGVYVCQRAEKLEPDEVNSLKQYCQDQWENGWGEGYAHCPRDSPALGLYIHFWQDPAAPLLTLEQLPAVQNVEHSTAAMTEVTPDSFWMLIDQAKNACGQDQRACAYWLTEQLVAMGPEQTLNFHSIMHGYRELADKYGLWNAATLILEDGCYSDGFEDFRAWLIAQGREPYMAALKDPDSLANVLVYGNCRFESLPYVGDMAYERLTGGRAYDDMDPDAHQQLVAGLRQEIVYGEGIGYPHEWSEVAAYLPRLTAQHLTPEELRSCIRRGHLWDHGNPDIQKARAAAPKKKTKTSKKKGGDAR